MKLIQKINQRNLTFSLLILILLGVSIYISVKMVIAEETDEKLEHTLQNVTSLIEKQQHLASLKPYIEVEEVTNQKTFFKLSDTILIDEDKEGEEFRQLSSIQSINNKMYKITIRESLLESEDLVKTMLWLISIGLVFLSGGLFYLNIRVSKSVWSPFYTNLNKLKIFELQKMEPFVPIESDIDEFTELNKVVKNLTNKVISDYGALKKFSENASHELQTPLAIIRTKIESLLDGNSLNDRQVNKIQSIYQSVNRLTIINKDLLFLTKIENSQFNNKETINLNGLVDNQLEQFQELADIKQIKLTKKFIDTWKLEADIHLVETLVTNLLTNAILHTIEKGEIEIEIVNQGFKISNSGNKPLENTDKLFERFYKGENTGSTGLGLAIVYEICKVLALKIIYSYNQSKHYFTVHKQTHTIQSFNNKVKS